MKINKLITAGIIMAAASAMALDYCEVTGVNARQRYPWNGLVDIDFTLDSKATEPYLMNVTVFDNVGKTNLPVKTVYTEGISFKENPCMVHKDTSRILWDAAADLPDGFKCTNVLVTCQDVRAGSVSNLYMIVDLSGGTSAESFPVTYTNCIPKGGWTEEHMTTKLVLRRVEPSSFMMGSWWLEEGHQNNETQHKVTLTKPFYIGIYEITAKQFSLIYGGAGSDTQPAKKDWPTVRGNDLTLGYSKASGSSATSSLSSTSWYYTMTITGSYEKQYCWPDTTDVDPASFMGKLRAKTSLRFDLPTEAQWERACRGGCEMALNIGVSNTVANVALIKGDAKLDPTETHYLYVGNYMPNSLGLYDTQGNVDEWCLDSYTADLGTDDVVDPDGGSVKIISKKFSGSMESVHYSSLQGDVTFDGKKFYTYTNTNPNQYNTFKWTYSGYSITRVVRGGNVRAASRSSAENVSKTGAIFNDGIKVGGTVKGKAAYTNPTHGIRVSLTVDE